MKFNFPFFLILFLVTFIFLNKWYLIPFIFLFTFIQLGPIVLIFSVFLDSLVTPVTTGLFQSFFFTYISLISIFILYISKKNKF